MSDLKTKTADLRGDVLRTGRRLELRLEAVKTDIVNGIFCMILGALIVNIIVEAGAMFAVAKLVGHRVVTAIGA
jgi:hypothetical protein